MSIHIEAAPGKIASRVLFPGDPLRAKWIAENFLTNVVQYSRVRNMLGFTGTAFEETPSEKRISVQGSGMGMSVVLASTRTSFLRTTASRRSFAWERAAVSGKTWSRAILYCPGRMLRFGYEQKAISRHGLRADRRIRDIFLSRAVELAKDMKIPVRVGNVLSHRPVL